MDDFVIEIVSQGLGWPEKCQRERKEALKILFLNGVSLRRTNDKQRRQNCKGRSWNNMGFTEKAESGAWWAVWNTTRLRKMKPETKAETQPVNRISLTLKKRCFSLGTIAQLERVQVENKEMFKELTWLWVEKRIIANLWGFSFPFRKEKQEWEWGAVDSDRYKTWGKFLPLVGTASGPACLYTDWNDLQGDRCYHKQGRHVEYSVWGKEATQVSVRGSDTE